MVKSAHDFLINIPQTKILGMGRLPQPILGAIKISFFISLFLIGDDDNDDDNFE